MDAICISAEFSIDPLLPMPETTSNKRGFPSRGMTQKSANFFDLAQFHPHMAPIEAQGSVNWRIKKKPPRPRFG